MFNASSGRGRLPIYLALLILISLFASYWPILQKLALRWNSGDNSYCYLVVPVFLYLCWERKEDFRFTEFDWSVWGLFPALLSVVTIIIGELGSVESLLYLGLWGCVISVIITMYGLRRSLALWFPLLILLFIIPLPPFINRILTFKMKMAASSLSVEMLRATGVSVLQNGNILDLGVTKMQVVDACSGLRYIVSMFLMALLIGHFFVSGWWRKILLVLLVYPLSIIINAVRIFITGILLIRGYQSLTEGVFHDGAGLIAFLVAGGVLFVFAGIIMKIGTVGKVRLWRDPGASQVSSFRPLLLTACFCMLFAGSGWGLQNMASALTIPQRNSFVSFPMEIAEWQGSRSYLSQEILDSLWADDYVNATFTRKGSPNVIYLLIPYYEYQGTRHTAHAPQSCLLGGGWGMTRSGTTRVAVPDREIDAGMMLLEKDNHRMLAGYFFLQRGRVIISPWWNKFYLMLDAVKMRRTDGALVRIEMTVAEGQDLDEAEKMLHEFIAGLWPLLSEYVPD